jgi:ABC-type transport system involved in multi-copper enzyme maturation permease subunit
VAAIAGVVVKEIFRKKDFYVAFVFTGIVLFYAARLRFYDVGNTYRYLMDIGLGLGMSFAALLTATLAARQFPAEMQGRTCHVLLSKAVSRREYVAGKFLGSFAAGASCYLLFFGVLLLFTLTKTHQVSFAAAAQAYVLFCMGLMLLTALCTALGFVMTPAANATVSLTLYLMISLYGVTLRQAAEKQEGVLRPVLLAVNLLIPHFGFFDMRQRLIHGWDPISWKLAALLCVYASAYSAVFLAIGWLLFRKKNIS